MYEIKELEQQWKRYKIKQLLPYAIGAIVVTILLGMGGFWYGFVSDTPPSKNHQAVSKSNQNDPSANTLTTQVAQKHIDTLWSPPIGTILSLTPQQPLQESKFSKKANLTTRHNVENVHHMQGGELPVEPINEIPIIQIDEDVGVSTQEFSTPQQPKKKKKLDLHIVATQSGELLQRIEKRFMHTKDSADALFLARRYYELKHYKKAEIWAKRANEINPDLEESWLIFVRSKIKQGHIEEGLRVLRAYVELSGSPKAAALLQRFQKR